jgi:hypothetical protein
MLWSTPFDVPIALEGTTLRTLRDAIKYLGTAIPKAEHVHPAVLTAATINTQAAEGRALIMHGRIGTLQAINRHKERVFTDRKVHHCGKRKLKRDK